MTTQPKVTRTPGLWKVKFGPELASSPSYFSIESFEGRIADINNLASSTEANAAYIVKAVNAHEDLLEACRQAIFAIPTTHGAFKTVATAIARAER